MAAPQRILVLLAGGLGDFILALPAIHHLREAWPGARLELAGNPSWLPLAREAGLARKVHSIDRVPLHAGFTGRQARDSALARFLEPFDLVVSWFGDREGLWGKALEALAPGRVLVAPFHRVHDFPGHASEYYLASLEPLALPSSRPPYPSTTSQPLLSPPPTTTPAGQPPYLCIHPGSGSPAKNWPAEGFLHVAREAFRHWEMPTAVVLGPAEEPDRGFWEEAAGPGLSIAPGPSILGLARILAGAGLYAGNDSGVTHLAAALGIPVVAIFGPSNPARWAPRGRLVQVLRAPGPPTSLQPDGLALVRPDQVLAALDRYRRKTAAGRGAR